MSIMSREPQPSSTAEKSRFSMTAVTAIHQRREKAVASVGAISAGSEAALQGPDWRMWEASGAWKEKAMIKLKVYFVYK